MASTNQNLPPLPPGFVLDPPQEMPPLPPGFVLDPPQEMPPLPPGFVLEESIAPPPRFRGIPINNGPRFGGVPLTPRDLQVAAPVASPQQSAAYIEALEEGSRASQFFYQEPAEPSLIDRIMGVADYVDNTGGIVLDRMGEGAANVAGLPVDVLNAAPMLANIIPGVDGVGPISSDPIGGSGWLNQLRKGFGIIPDAPEPQDAFQTIAGRVGEEIGASVLPIGGLLGAGGKMGAQAARNSSNPLVRTFIAPAANSPSRFVGGEVAGATAAGAGAGIANMFADRDTSGGQIADMAGAVGGATVAGIGGVLGRGLGNIFNAVRQNPNYVDQIVKDAVVDRIGKGAGLVGSESDNGAFDTSQLVDLIFGRTSEAERVAGASPQPRPSNIIPGYQESLADMTANPGIASLEYSRQSGPNAGMFTKQRGANNEAVDAAMRSIEPTETPGAFRSELEAQREMRLSAAADSTQSAQSDFDAYIQNLSPQMLAEERGATIRGGLANAQRSAREVENAAWQGIDGQVETGPLADTLDQTIDGLSMARRQGISDLDQTTNIPRQLAGTVDEPAGPVAIRELTDMRSKLLTERRNALSGAEPDRDRAEVLNRLIDDMNTYMDSNAVAPDVRAQTTDARSVSANVNERFNRPNDPIASVLATSQGRPDVPDSAVGPRFVQPDSRQASNIDRLLAETDLSSQGGSVREAVKDEILAGMERRGTTPERIDDYLGQFTKAFDRFPDLRDEVAQAASAGRRLDTASTAETALTRDVGSADGTVAGKGPVGRYLQYSDAQSERAINEVLNAKDPGAAADSLLSFIDNNPRASEGARAAFWKKLQGESQSVDNSQRSMGGGRAWRGDWLKSFLDKPSTAAVAERLYRDQPEALANIRAYADVLDNVDLRQRGKAAGTSGTAQGTNPVLTPETLQSRFYAWKRGAISGTYLATSIAAVVARRAVRNAQGDAIERLTDQVLLNPQLAAELLKENNPANRAALARKARTYFGNEASTFVNLMDQEDKPDDDSSPVKGPLSIVVDGANTIGEYGDDIVNAVMR